MDIEKISFSIIPGTNTQSWPLELGAKINIFLFTWKRSSLKSFEKLICVHTRHEWKKKTKPLWKEALHLSNLSMGLNMIFRNPHNTKPTGELRLVTHHLGISTSFRQNRVATKNKDGFNFSPIGRIKGVEKSNL